MFAWDKYRAVSGGWRVSERMLLFYMLCGGFIGAMVGQSFFRHKTTKGSFVWRFWLVVLVWLSGLFLLLFKS